MLPEGVDGPPRVSADRWMSRGPFRSGIRKTPSEPGWLEIEARTSVPGEQPSSAGAAFLPYHERRLIVSLPPGRILRLSVLTLREITFPEPLPSPFSYANCLARSMDSREGSNFGSPPPLFSDRVLPLVVAVHCLAV